jgi:hypothetical protein
MKSPQCLYMKPTLVALFGAVAIVLVIVAFGVWQYEESRPVPLPPNSMKQVDNPVIGDQSANVGAQYFKTTITKGKWVDTGMWVGPWTYVIAISTGQPCELMVGETTTTAQLLKTGVFKAFIATTDNTKGIRDVSYNGESVSLVLAPIGNHAKIYLKVNDEATVEQLEVTIGKGQVSNDDIEKHNMKGQVEVTQGFVGQYKGIIIGVVVLIVSNFLSFIVGHRVALRAK